MIFFVVSILFLWCFEFSYLYTARNPFEFDTQQAILKPDEFTVRCIIEIDGVYGCVIEKDERVYRAKVHDCIDGYSIIECDMRSVLIEKGSYKKRFFL